MIPNDEWVVKWIYRQYALNGCLQTDELMHMAGSFGMPGSQTEGGIRYKQHATELAEHNLLGIIYAIQRGWIAASDVHLPDLKQHVGVIST